MKHQRQYPLLRDTGIALAVLACGVLLLWAGSNNGLEYLVILLILLLPLLGVCFIFSNPVKPNPDN